MINNVVDNSNRILIDEIHNDENLYNIFITNRWNSLIVNLNKQFKYTSTQLDKLYDYFYEINR